ncbi:DUF2528 family protein [Thauera butanivorans]|uniref:DUF2528 family protein n=1 Tax=Thauera butanivorans TaxID=86174 RepID=UPI000838D6E8|nr:DUF2528 family protein [Thauera butanivorans]
MSTKRYRLSGDNFDMTVEVDHAVLTEDKLHEINNFWSAADHRLKEHDGSVLDAVLEMLFNHVQRLIVEDSWGLNLYGVLHEFAWKDDEGNRKNGQEGWPDMDGSYGISIVRVSDVDLDENPIIAEVQP